MAEQRLKRSDIQFRGTDEQAVKLRRMVDDLRDAQAYINRLASQIATATATTVITDHGELDGLGDDDHPQYLTSARGDARYYTEAEIDALIASLTASIAASTGVDEGYAYFLGGQ